MNELLPIAVLKLAEKHNIKVGRWEDGIYYVEYDGDWTTWTSVIRGVRVGTVSNKPTKASAMAMLRGWIRRKNSLIKHASNLTR